MSTQESEEAGYRQDQGDSEIKEILDKSTTDNPVMIHVSISRAIMKLGN